MRLRDKVRNQRGEINYLRKFCAGLINRNNINDKIIEEQQKIIRSSEYMLDGMSIEERSKLLAKYCPNCFNKLDGADCICRAEWASEILELVEREF